MAIQILYPNLITKGTPWLFRDSKHLLTFKLSHFFSGVTSPLYRQVTWFYYRRCNFIMNTHNPYQLYQGKRVHVKPTNNSSNTV